MIVIFVFQRIFELFDKKKKDSKKVSVPGDGNLPYEDD